MNQDLNDIFVDLFETIMRVLTIDFMLKKFHRHFRAILKERKFYKIFESHKLMGKKNCADLEIIKLIPEQKAKIG